LLPNYGSDTNWYKNLLVDPTLKISVSGGEEIPTRGKPITDSYKVDDIFGKFKSKYGEVKQYYPKVDVAVEVLLCQTLKKKIEVGEHYFTRDELDAIWWDGYEHGSIDSAYDRYDKGCAAAISDLESTASLKCCNGGYY
jgi:hypothetical protein